MIGRFRAKWSYKQNRDFSIPSWHSTSCVSVFSIVISEFLQTADMYFEQQEGSLCAQHCINNRYPSISNDPVLQSQLFSAVDLAELASNLDELEKAALAEGNSEPSSIPFKSSNVDDDGFFSRYGLLFVTSTAKFLSVLFQHFPSHCTHKRK
jgi:hypothetical protein